jgi:2-polyprenyl-3-methyl-5-hydroxy-6-metoxy-1,4-benzoquinol methylase
MPTISCLICSSEKTNHCLTLHTVTGKITYFQCAECSLVFQDPAIPFKEEEIYNNEYIQKRSQDPGNPPIALSREKTAQHYYHWVEKNVPKGNLLEVGCATGLALKIAQSRGWNAFGVEINRDAALIAKDMLKADIVKVGHLSDNMFPDGYFSLVTLFDVIEHIPRPVEFLSILHKKIAPGGSILFVTPNVDTLSFKILKKKWPHFVREHLLLYSPKSMDRLLKETGFIPKARGRATKYISLEMLKTHTEHHPNVHFYKPVNWLLEKTLSQAKIVFPFNMGEMFVLAQKTPI